MTQDDNLPIYALRVLPRAERDIDAHTVRMAELAGAHIARAWYEGLFQSVASLARNPRRFPVIAENSRFRREVWQMLYRRTASGPVWRVLFMIEESVSDDAPTILLLHVRHTAQHPITLAEARRIEQEQG